MPEWTLLPGQRIKRTDLHQQFGGSRQNGISPSRDTPNIFVFSDPASGEQHGYVDGWKDDGCFHYTGEGQRGDQKMVRGNLAVLEAETSGRTLRLFYGAGGEPEYRGRFVLDRERPWYRDDAPETDDGPMRSVIVFRMRPLDMEPEHPQGLPAVEKQTHVENVPVEERFTEKAIVEPTRELYEAERRESALVHEFCSWIARKGYVAERMKITPADEAKPIFTDLLVKELNMLIEAKGSTDRSSIRMAIGQIADYRRFAPEAVTCAVLLPSLPRPDLLNLLASVGMQVCYPVGHDFVMQNGDGACVELTPRSVRDDC
jgi:hypothetical protein